MRLAVAQIIVNSLKKLKLTYPAVADEEKARFSEMRRMLEKEEE
jgi:hypothetical protein